MPFRVLLALVSALYPPSLHAFELEKPLDCRIGMDCFIQNYVDMDPAQGAYKDFHCGRLAYDGHDGTDFRLINVTAMREGVSVLASAEGLVKAARDGMNDANVKTTGKDGVKDRECGNGVVIDHGGGWETQYCHMMKGSVAVKQGESVRAGDRLGAVGLSGMTEFPHLHVTVRRNGKELDPFTGREVGAGCDLPEKQTPLWSAASGLRFFYQPTALLSAGFSAAAPDTASAIDDLAALPSLARDAEAMVIWVNIMGVQANDVLKVQLVNPKGETRTFSKIFEEPKAQMFYYTGIKSPGSGFISGRYTGHISLLRDQRGVFQQDVSVEVE